MEKLSRKMFCIQGEESEKAVFYAFNGLGTLPIEITFLSLWWCIAESAGTVNFLKLYSLGANLYLYTMVTFGQYIHCKWWINAGILID